MGKGTSVRWPGGLGAKGNEGVAGMIRQMDGAFGYVELIYAIQNKIPFGLVKNSSGAWIKGSLESTDGGRSLGEEHARTTFASPSPIRPARTLIPSPALPGCCCRRS